MTGGKVVTKLPKGVEPKIFDLNNGAPDERECPLDGGKVVTKLPKGVK